MCDLAIRAEATIVGRCPCCGSTTGVIPALEPGAYSDMTWGHEHWCPAVDDSIAWLFQRAGAEMRHTPLFLGELFGSPFVVVLMGRKGKRPLDAEQIGRLLSTPASRDVERVAEREKRNRPTKTPARSVTTSLSRPV